ncbi:MAG: hypothetical protein LC714_08720 [Actinobacteria bacterium]|nr:hypothetical protein [Actinomycetota bacterium]
MLQRRPPLAGADEAGRGALAGPLVATAVVLGEGEISDLNDSKLLSPSLRERLLGDVLRCAAASVVAKVLRDGAMRAMAGDHAGYGFERNCGYGTPEHRLALAQLGPCRVHRLSYAGVVG